MLILPDVSRALESDQYMTWGRELRDVSSELNTHVNQTIEKALEELAGEKKAVSCAKAHNFAVKKFRGFIVHKIESWLEEDLGDDLYPQANMSYPDYFTISIYNYQYSAVGRFFPMGRNLNYNGVILGSDKLAHFISTGLRYFNVFQAAKKKGLSDEKAEQKAIRYGISLERSYLGLWPSGVFSWGDLEANYQGLQMNRRFCDGDRPYLTQDAEGHWRLANLIDMGDFLNPYMDETFNPSFFGALKWLKVKPMLLKYCARKSTPEVAGRMDYYKSIAIKSYNIRYLEELAAAGDRSIPNRERQYLSAICK
ncbi:MAG: hypothetical protein A2X86_18955 [Bdellovibrionales bacterium GWA2_49_15]|nr:MAG: hypothetical protein A2X86_18955 [Bdellovibrionales bacterium GWA2_49_15]HAZ14306.1 hypothetical protein [Bdellovibrionales bacterium]